MRSSVPGSGFLRALLSAATVMVITGVLITGQAGALRVVKVMGDTPDQNPQPGHPGDCCEPWTCDSPSSDGC